MSIGIKLGIFSELDAAAAGGGEVTPGSILLTPSAQGTHTEWHTNDFTALNTASGSVDTSEYPDGDPWGYNQGLSSNSAGAPSNHRALVLENSTTSYIATTDPGDYNVLGTATWTVRPSDGASWTSADIDSLEIGYSVYDDGSQMDSTYETSIGAHLDAGVSALPEGATIDSVQVDWWCRDWDYKYGKTWKYQCLAFQLYAVVSYS